MAARFASSLPRAVAPAIRRQIATSSPSRFYSSSSRSSESKSYGRTYAYGGAGAGGLALSAGLFSWFSGEKKNDIDYQEVYNAIAEILESESYDDGSYGPVLLRLAWHCSGTYDKESKTGGSNYATMRFSSEGGHGANAGLVVARNLLEPIHKKYPNISYGDLWTLAGVCAIQEMGGPIVPWRPGRVDGFEINQTPDGRLPDGDKGAPHVRDIFYRMGFNDQEIVALIGAHALGRCHKDRSGFDGPWTFSPTTFTNDFYKLLKDEKWTERKWNGPPQFEDAKTRTLMMLRTDVAMVTDPNFKKYAALYADNEKAFFDDFSKAFGKLIELGVPEQNFKSGYMKLKKTEEQ
ncbi:class II peroxidase [Atractiella rhizophila]|nr:class II peroxidase [Atractiella rhizophila]